MHLKSRTTFYEPISAFRSVISYREYLEKKTDVTHSVVTMFVAATTTDKMHIIMYTAFSIMLIVLICFPSHFRSCNVIREKFNKPITAKEVSLPKRVLVTQIYLFKIFKFVILYSSPREK